MVGQREEKREEGGGERSAASICRHMHKIEYICIGPPSKHQKWVNGRCPGAVYCGSFHLFCIVRVEKKHSPVTFRHTTEKKTPPWKTR